MGAEGLKKHFAKGYVQVIYCSVMLAHKAEIRSQADCWTCGACVKACPVQAIDLKLPSQILKSNVSIRAQCKKQHTVWEIRNGNGIKEEFVIPAITENGVG